MGNNLFDDSRSWVLDFDPEESQVLALEKRTQEREKIKEGLTSQKTLNVLTSSDLSDTGTTPVDRVDDWTFRDDDWLLEDDHKVISLPAGVGRGEFNYFVELYLQFHKTHGRLPGKPAEGLSKKVSQLTILRGEIITSTPEFRLALRKRGITLVGSGLGSWREDPRKMQALTILTDPLAKGTFEAKLRRVGINSTVWDSWLADPEFAKEFRNLTEKNFTLRQGEINLAVQEMALRPGHKQLEAIKYFNEISGRFDPARRQVMDMQQFTQGVIDILTSEVADAETLQKIAGKLALLVGGSGVTRIN